MDEYGFGKAWVEAEQEAVDAMHVVTEMVNKLGDSEDVLDTEKAMREAQIALLNSISAELRALRLFMVARFAQEEDGLSEIS